METGTVDNMQSGILLQDEIYNFNASQPAFIRGEMYGPTQIAAWLKGKRQVLTPTPY